MEVPTMEQTLSIVEAMASRVEQGKKVLVHCHAGLGRTGLVIACHLVHMRLHSAMDAVHLVQQQRPGACSDPAADPARCHVPEFPGKAVPTGFCHTCRWEGEQCHGTRQL
eukprot:TRINITY_DN5624_c0_g1_i1.p1 TRINITY_DN5624_c0_g1~~TRINITY_DN5624_c0_g1_i1.p1  ORF type:complete len:117 (+),score=23.75 TRINITY_DN5624_c0_g1_i1:23-352(+)